MANKALNERVAVLETTVKHLTDKIDQILAGVEKLTDNQGLHQRMFDSLNSRWGFVTLMLSGTFAAILAFKDWILFKLFGIGHG